MHDSNHLLPAKTEDASEEPDAGIDNEPLIGNGTARTQNDYHLVPSSADVEDVSSSQIDVITGPLPEYINYRGVLTLSLLDVCNSFLLTIGFFYIGSGMFQVIYSSVVVWCALLSRAFLGRRLSVQQWASIFGVSIGLAISAVGINQNPNPDAPPTPAPTTGIGPAIVHTLALSTTAFGTLLTFVGTFGFACVYVVSDRLVSTNPPNTRLAPPRKICFATGCCTSIVGLVYVLVYTVPHWDQLVTEEMRRREPHSSTAVICIMFVVLMIAALLHNMAYYWLVKHTGNVSTGLLQSVRAIVVFGLSHMMFCAEDSGQCFTPAKGLSAVIVIGCVTLFSLSRQVV